MTVSEIVRKSLADNGYDGLCGDECFCFIGGLIPCESPCRDCEPGYAYNMNRGKTCKGCEDKDKCPFFDFDGWISKRDRICALSDFPVKCREKGGCQCLANQ